MHGAWTCALSMMHHPLSSMDVIFFFLPSPAARVVEPPSFRSGNHACHACSFISYLAVFQIQGQISSMKVTSMCAQIKGSCRNIICVPGSKTRLIYIMALYMQPLLLPSDRRTWRMHRPDDPFCMVPFLPKLAFSVDPIEEEEEEGKKKKKKKKRRRRKEETKRRQEIYKR
jgi:hypothetical protein